MLKNFTPGSSLKPETNDYLVQYTVVCSGAEKDAVLWTWIFYCSESPWSATESESANINEETFICIIQPCPFSRV